MWVAAAVSLFIQLEQRRLRGGLTSLQLLTALQLLMAALCSLLCLNKHFG